MGSILTSARSERIAVEEADIKRTASLRRKILVRDLCIGVIGQGYVGLTLACAAASEGFRVVGIDVDAQRIEELRSGQLAVPGVNEQLFRSAISSGRMELSTDTEEIARADIIVICVPTPLRNGSPDLSFVEGAALRVAEHLTAGKLVILESTTYPGTTEEILRPVLESSGLIAGRDFLLSYSPERVDPGNIEYDFRSIPRIVGGLTSESTGVATLFYAQLVDKVVSVSSCRAAELAKLLENTFRHVNIALVNEMAMLCHEVGIEVWEVISAASSKPFGFMSFQPGPGVGGHCIPLDSTYLAWQVRRDAGHQFRILEQAEDINAQMPTYVAGRIGEALNEGGKALKGAKIVVLGVTYKPDVGDIRESPVLKVIAALRKRGANVAFHDPFISEVVLNGGIRMQRSELTHGLIGGAACVALLTPHRSYDLNWVADHARLVFDARNAFGDDKRTNVVRL